MKGNCFTKLSDLIFYYFFYCIYKYPVFRKEITVLYKTKCLFKAPSLLESDSSLRRLTEVVIKNRRHLTASTISWTRGARNNREKKKLKHTSWRTQGWLLNHLTCVAGGGGVAPDGGGADTSSNPSDTVSTAGSRVPTASSVTSKGRGCRGRTQLMRQRRQKKEKKKDLEPVFLFFF